MAPLRPALAWDSVPEWSLGFPSSGLAPGPLQPATQRPKARAPLIVPWRTRAGRRRATKYNSEHSSSGPGRMGRSGPPGLGVLGPASALELLPREGTRTAPFPQSAPAGAGVRLQEKLVSGFAFRTKPARPAHCSGRALAGSVLPDDRERLPELSRTPGRDARAGSEEAWAGRQECGAERRERPTGLGPHTLQPPVNFLICFWGHRHVEPWWEEEIYQDFPVSQGRSHLPRGTDAAVHQERPP